MTHIPNLRGIRIIAIAVGLLLSILFFIPRTTAIGGEEQSRSMDSQETIIRQYLKSKNSPLAEHTKYLLQHNNWQLLIAISSIESQFCKRKIDFNCWGIGGDSAYRHYKSYDEAIDDANKVINTWRSNGRWFTLEDMNCSYVQPCNQNWVKITNQTLKEIKTILQ